jgi:protein pelota
MVGPAASPSFPKSLRTWYATPPKNRFDPFDQKPHQWHAYNLIVPGDLLYATAIRRVTTTAASTGSTSSSRVRLTLEIRVKNLDFDPQNSQLHVSGQIVNETPHTKIGQHHTLDLELNRQFTLEKGSGQDGEGSGWDSVAVEALKDAVDEGGNRRAEAVAVVMQEGLAHICFIGQFRTVLKQKVEISVPRKRAGGSDHDKVFLPIEDFIQQILTAPDTDKILPNYP